MLALVAFGLVTRRDAAGHPLPGARHRPRRERSRARRARAAGRRRRSRSSSASRSTSRSSRSSRPSSTSGSSPSSAPATPRRSERSVTSREALALGVVAAPALGAVLVALAPRRAVTAVALAAALVTCGTGARAGGGRARRARRPVRGRLDRRRRRRRAARRRHRLSSGSRASSSPPRTRHRASALVGPSGARARTTCCCSRSGRSCSPSRSPAISPAPGCSSRRPRRPPRPGGVQRQPARARGRLEVPDPDHARARRRPARDRAPRRRHARRRARGLSWHALPTYARRARRRSSPTSCCSPVSPRRSAGRRCTTGCPTPTPRLHRPSRRSSPRRSFPRCCSSPGARSSRSRPVVGAGTAQSVLIGFGLVSLAVAVPFLWRPLAWKRLLAYSSLEHMGVIALGIGFATPLALAGVAVHIVAHAVAKALGFYAAAPLLGHEPRAAGHSVTGIARTQPALGTTMGISLGVLAGLPPLPLFVSEVLIVAGGFQAGRTWAAAAAALLLALGFLGLAHAWSRRRSASRTAATATQARASAASRCSRPSRRRCSSASAAPRSGCPGSDLVEALAEGGRVTAPADAYRDAVAEALADGWRFAGLHATARRSARPHAARRTGRHSRLETAAADEGTVPSIVDLAPAADWDEREAARPLRRPLRRPRAAAAARRPRPRLDALDGPRARRRPVPGRGRADPRRRDRVGPLPLPRRRRPHPPPRRAALLQAPRARARRRRHDARRRARLRRTRLRRLRGDERRRLRARVRGGARARADRRARPRAHDPARARADVEPPQRHRRRLRRRRPRRGQQPLRRAHRARAPAQRAR